MDRCVIRGVTFRLSVVFAAAGLSLGFVRAQDDTVLVREEVLGFREHFDGWNGTFGADFAYTNGQARLVFEKSEGCLEPKRKCPGPRRMKGAIRYVLRTEGGLSGDATMCLRREARDHGTNVYVKAKATLAKDTEFTFDLDSHEVYYLNDISFLLKGSGQTTCLRGIDAVTRETVAEALRVDVETGNPLHIVRDGKDERAELVLRNPSERKLDWRVHLKVEDFFGNCREGDFPVSLEVGGVMRRPMKEVLPKGVRYVTLVASAAGTAATNRTTWAYLDTHEVTPLQPEDEVRIGFNFHGMRMMEGNTALGIDAAVALGAKLVRTDVMHFCGVRLSENVWDWARCDRYLASLTEHGIALNAIVWWPEGWAQEKDAEGKPLFSLRPDALRDYGVALGKRYGDRVAYYEVGNEWDLTKPNGFPYDVAVGQVRVFAEGLKSVCPTAKVIPCGFATDSSVRHPSKRVRPMFHENLIRDVQDVVDAHPVHIHSPVKEFTFKVRNFLEWRERMGVRLPWYANETALSSSSMRPTDRALGIGMWQKVLFAISRGSIDYIWYNLRATGWNPDDSEQGFGVFSADWHPRTGAAAFAALASTFRHQAADGIPYDGLSRQVLRFRDARGGKVRVIAGWDEFAEKPMRIRVKTDAKTAWQVDTMGNRSAVAIQGGVAVWQISTNPSALYLEDCRSAAPDVADLTNEAKRPVQAIVLTEKANPILEFEKNRHVKTDILINSYDHVYEVFKAMPEHADRCWKWWGDLWVRVNFARTDGRVWMNINCWDDVHVPDFDHPLEGDAVMLRLGNWKVQLVGSDKRCEVKILEKPKGAADPKDGWAKLTFKSGYEKNYFFEFDPAALGFKDEIPFNIRVYDNDGKGFDGWMEYAPIDEAECPALLKL